MAGLSLAFLWACLAVHVITMSQASAFVVTPRLTRPPSYGRGRIPASQKGILAQIRDFTGSQGQKDAVGGKEEYRDSEMKVIQFGYREATKVPKMQVDKTSPRTAPWMSVAAILALSSAVTGTPAHAATQLFAEDAAAAETLAEPSGIIISNGLAIALVAPLILFKLDSVVFKKPVLPALDFVTGIAVCALFIRIAANMGG